MDDTVRLDELRVGDIVELFKYRHLDDEVGWSLYPVEVESTEVTCQVVSVERDVTRRTTTFSFVEPDGTISTVKFFTSLRVRVVT